jgi:hypothetical protein
MKSIKTTLAALLLTAAFLPWVSCKKENTTKSTITKEKILGKWNWISEVNNSYYSGMSHITTYNFAAGDYFEFKSDGKVTEYESGTELTYDYGIIDETRIWMLIPSNIFTLKLITATDLQLYQKNGSGTDYDESTLNFKR